MNMVKHKRGSISALSAQHEAELKALANKPDDDIDYSDIPVTEDKQWSEATRGKFFRPLKTQASVRIDADVMEWLKRPGKGYQTRLYRRWTPWNSRRFGSPSIHSIPL